MSELGIFYPNVPSGGETVIATIKRSHAVIATVDKTLEELNEAFTQGKVVRGCEQNNNKWYTFDPNNHFISIQYDMSAADEMVELEITQVSYTSGETWNVASGVYDIIA